MVKQSPHKRWRGHCLLCCGGIKIRGAGTSIRRTGSELKQAFDGKKRRVKRNEVAAFDYGNPDAEEIDCQHGCNGDCYEWGSERCNFTCHPRRYEQ